MKKAVVLFTGILFCIASLAQSHENESYLIVRLKQKNDRTNKTLYFSIAADPYNDDSKEIYNLVPFHDEPYSNSSGISFFFNKTASSVFLYNYFRSETEALKFLSQKRWQLLSVVPEISSGHENEKSGDNYIPYTTVSSTPVYYFKKTIF